MDDTSATPRHNLPQSDPGLLPRGFPPIIKDWGPEGFAPILSSGELHCEGKLHRRYSHGVGFQIFFYASRLFCGVKGFTVAGVQVLPPTY